MRRALRQDSCFANTRRHLVPPPRSLPAASEMRGAPVRANAEDCSLAGCALIGVYSVTQVGERFIGERFLLGVPSKKHAKVSIVEEI